MSLSQMIFNFQLPPPPVPPPPPQPRRKSRRMPSRSSTESSSSTTKCCCPVPIPGLPPPFTPAAVAANAFAAGVNAGRQGVNHHVSKNIQNHRNVFILFNFLFYFKQILSLQKYFLFF